jgi:hypothetical protein
MSKIYNRARSSLFSVLTIDLEKSRGQWRVLLGDRKIGKPHERKSQAIQEARRIRKAWAHSIAEAESEGYRLMEQIESYFAKVALETTGGDRVDSDLIEGDAQPCE